MKVQILEADPVILGYPNRKSYMGISSYENTIYFLYYNSHGLGNKYHPDIIEFDFNRWVECWILLKEGKIDFNDHDVIYKSEILEKFIKTINFKINEYLIITDENEFILNYTTYSEKILQFLANSDRAWGSAMKLLFEGYGIHKSDNGHAYGLKFDYVRKEK